VRARPQPRLVSLALTCLLALAAAAAAAAGAPARAATPVPPRLSAPSATVFEESSDLPVLARNAGQRRLIASTTKMMTALLTVESLHLTHVCTAPPYAATPLESKIGLRAGERMTVHDLLQAVMLPSANDAANALSICVAGSRGAFVARMNRRAAMLGLRHTHFTTPVGLDDGGNYSTAADLARLAIALRRNGFMRRTMDLPRARLRSGDRPRTIVNRNDLVLDVPWVDGVKTGHTNAAGYILVASGTQEGLTFVSVVLGDPSEGTRDADALALLRWAFASFRMATPVTRGVVYARPRDRDRPGARIDLVAASSVRRLLPRAAGVRVETQAPHELAGPLKRGTREGTLIVRAGKGVIARVPLLTRRAVAAVPLLTRAARTIAAPGSLVAIAVLVGGAAVLLRRRHWRADSRRADMEAAA
jgi:serine-type D-Ala-D-Ala carboxypeptidase (penicillin-binding protein 5/6)